MIVHLPISHNCSCSHTSNHRYNKYCCCFHLQCHNTALLPCFPSLMEPVTIQHIIQGVLSIKCIFRLCYSFHKFITFYSPLSIVRSQYILFDLNALFLSITFLFISLFILFFYISLTFIRIIYLFFVFQHAILKFKIKKG